MDSTMARTDFTRTFTDSSASPYSIPIFAGQGTFAALSDKVRLQATRDASGLEGSLLLSACYEAFLCELRSLTQVQRDCVSLQEAQLPTRDSLLSSEPTPLLLHNAVISGLHLFLVQVLRYLPSHPNIPHMFAAFSSGLLPACVSSASYGILSYISNAVEAFRLAFWIGFRAEEWKRSIWDEQGSWTIVLVGMTREAIDEGLSEFSSERIGYPSLHVTSILNTTSFAVSGRPDVLSSFLCTLPSGVVAHKTTMNALYHCGVLGNLKVQVAEDVRRRAINFPSFKDLRVPITGLEMQDGTALLDKVLDMILMRPVDWLEIVERVSVSFNSHKNVIVDNYGPGSGLAEGIVKALAAQGVRVRLSDAYSLGNEGVRTSAGTPAGFQLKQEPIAIVGMALCMPWAPDADALWRILEQGINAVSEIPETRFSVTSYTTDQSHPGRRMEAHMGNFISEYAAFDASFFGISPREANSMDPQQRVLLHVAYHALESAGHVPDPETEHSKEGTGVWVGASTSDYVQNLRENIDIYYTTGTNGAFLSGRISHTLKLGGPSIVVNTACSSSLVAIYQACRALMNRDCKTALAGGVNIITSPDTFLGLDRAHFLSPTGQCKPFDVSADGYCRGEGCGLFVLKRLADAVLDHDNILGVVRGVEVNQSAAHSITHPHGPSQAILLRELTLNAGLTDVRRVSVVEAHGSGTQAGDPSEINAIRKVLGVGRTDANPLYITSIKANIGHLEAASGAAGLAKLVLMLRHSLITPQILFRELNPGIARLEDDHTIIAKRAMPWARMSADEPRLAVLNNFGAAGSNAALLLEEWIPTRAATPTNMTMSYVFGLSAKSPEALEALRSEYLAWLRSSRSESIHMGDLAYTMTTRRLVYAHRLAFAATCREELISRLAAVKPSMIQRLESNDVRSTADQVVFLFSGQGGQHFGMGASLYRSLPLFREKIDECHRILISNGFVGVKAMVVAASENNLDLGDEILASQTAVFAVEYALAMLWISWGVRPAAIVGHSLGEYAALVVAKVVTLQDALLTVAHRAKCMASCASASTGMLAVKLQISTVEAVLISSNPFTELSIACYNGPCDCVVSGPLNRLTALKEHLECKFACKSLFLHVPYGFHSPAMHPMINAFERVARCIEFRPPCVPVCSNVTGKLVMPGDDSVFTRDYFLRHCLQPALFHHCVESLLSQPLLSKVKAWIEIGPHPASLATLRKYSPLADTLLLASLRKHQEAWVTLTDTLAHLYCSDVRMAWGAVFSHLPSVRCVETPAYPLAMTEFWVSHRDNLSLPADSSTFHLRVPSPDYSMLRFCTQMASSANGNLAVFETPIHEIGTAILGHKVAGLPLCPSSLYLEQVLSGIQIARRCVDVSLTISYATLKEVEFIRALVYEASVDQYMKTSIKFREDLSGDFSVSSLVRGSEELVHVHGRFVLQAASQVKKDLAVALPVLKRRMTETLQSTEGELSETFSSRTVYDVIFPRVVTYSGRYRTVVSLTVDSTGMGAVAFVRLPSENAGMQLERSLFLDSLLHVAGFIANLQADYMDAYICCELGSMKVVQELVCSGHTYAVYCRNQRMSGGISLAAEVYVLQKEAPHTIVGHIENIVFRRSQLDDLKQILEKARISLKLRASSTIHNERRYQDSADHVEGEVIQLIAGACNIHPMSFNSRANLRDLGVDSLMSIEIIHKLQVMFPKVSFKSLQPLPFSVVSDIVHFIISSGSRDTSSHCNFTSTVTEMFPNNFSLVSKGVDDRTGSAAGINRTQFSFDQLGRATRSDCGSPLFLFHDGSGLTHNYQRLPSLSRNVWAIENPNFTTMQPWNSIFDMAEHYAEQIQAIVPIGDVLLGGSSFGGVVAVECARQLLLIGYSVKGVILIDSPCPIAHAPLSDRIIDFALKLHCPQNSNSEIGDLVKAQMQMNALLLARYEPCNSLAPYPSLALLHSKEPFRPCSIRCIPRWLGKRDSAWAAAVWEALVDAPVEVWEIPGNHFQSFVPENIQQVSFCLNDACEYLDSTIR